MTKIWRKNEWEQQLRKNPDDCISIPKGLVLNRNKKKKEKKDVKCS